MKAPGSLPTCEHGRIAGTSCKECYHRDELIRAQVKPLADEFWTEQGKRDLNHLMYRAYRMGVKSVTVDGMSFAICAAFHHEEITRSKGRELHGFKSIQEFNHVYDEWLQNVRDES